MEHIKEAIGTRAASLIEDGMHVGLGSGSTSACFIRALAKRCKEGLRIKAVASSTASAHLALQEQIPLLNIETLSQLDITVDGADEIDPIKRMIKGRGGALVREKILANMSKEMIVIIDETKLVSHLGKADLPIEIIPFAFKATQRHLQEAGFQGTWRTHEQKPYITDNGNYIFDISFDALRDNPEHDEERLMRIPGVVDTGFFFDMAGRVIIGFLDGTTAII